MNLWKSDWAPKEGVAVGKGATLQEFVATVGDDELEIDVAPWGEGHLKVQVTSAKDRRQAFRQLKKMAERYVQMRASKPESKRALP